MKKKNKIGGLTVTDFKAYYKARVNKTVQYCLKDIHRLMKPNRETRNRPIHTWSTDFHQRCRQINGEDSFTINGAETIRHLYAKVNPDLHLAPYIKINPTWVIDLNVKP